MDFDQNRKDLVNKSVSGVDLEKFEKAQLVFYSCIEQLQTYKNESDCIDIANDISKKIYGIWG